MNMNGSKPKVTIAVPVFNGDNYLAETLDSVLSQTFQNFEVVIADNGSTDGTEKICRDYAARDPRIQIHRSEVNLGVTRNFIRVVGFSSAEYFMYLAHDDKLAPSFLEQCVAVLDTHPDVVLCYPKAIEIDTQGNALYKKEQFLDADCPRPHKRFRQMIRMDHNCESQFGLIRADVLKKTVIFAPIPDGDRIMLAELSLYGKYYRVSDYLFLHREHADRTLNVYPTRFDRLPMYLVPQQAGKLILPHFAEFFEYLRCIRRVPLKFAERLACYGEMLRWLKDNYRRLEGDVLYVLKRFVKRALGIQAHPSVAQ
jgi:glycosyltransferase involved in cell wall biosynthesis